MQVGKLSALHQQVYKQSICREGPFATEAEELAAAVEASEEAKDDSDDDGDLNWDSSFSKRVRSSSSSGSSSSNEGDALFEKNF